MKNLFKLCSVLTLMIGSFAFAQQAPKSEDIKVQTPTNAGKMGISIKWVIGRTSKDCASFGVCKGSSIEINLPFADIDVSFERQGVLVEKEGNKYFKFDLAAPIDPKKFDANLYVDNDMVLEAKDTKLTIVSGVYKPDYSTNRNGTYYVLVK